MEENKTKCILCNNDEGHVPLLQLRYNGTIYWICPEHLPTLIHQPDKLVGALPGAENMQAG